MSNKYLTFDDRLITYLRQVSLREPEILRRLREETATHHQSQMQILPEQGQFMAMLIELTGAEDVIEVGTFTGYSALIMALALPKNGRLTTCDVNPETTAIARRYWEEAGVAHKIESRLAPAIDSLESLLKDDAWFDVAFLDADKANIEHYYELCYRLIRPGGLILIDNVLWSGKVADPGTRDEDTNALRALNRKLKDDDRITLSMLPIGDGLTLARKRHT